MRWDLFLGSSACGEGICSCFSNQARSAPICVDLWQKGFAVALTPVFGFCCCFGFLLLAKGQGPRLFLYDLPCCLALLLFLVFCCCFCFCFWQRAKGQGPKALSSNYQLTQNGVPDARFAWRGVSYQFWVSYSCLLPSYCLLPVAYLLAPGFQSLLCFGHFFPTRLVCALA